MATKGIVINISGSGEGAVEALRQIEAKMQETAVKGKEAGESLAKSMREFQEGIMLLRDTYLLDRAYESIKGMIEKSMELGVELNHLSQQTGITVENLSALKFASEESGVSFETLTKGFKKLSTTIFELHEGSKLATDTFKDLGISQKDLGAAGNDMYKVMALVADKFREMPDGIQKNALATQLFGRAGQELIPILNQGAQAIDDIKKRAPIFTEEDIQKMEEMHKATADLSAAWERMSLTLSSKAAPALSAWFKLIASGESPYQTFSKYVANEVVALGQLTRLVSSTKLDLKAPSAPGVPFAADSPAAPKPAHTDKSLGVEMSTLRQIDAEAKREEEALTRLVAAEENARLQVVKSGSSLRLAQLEAEHKEGLVTEEAYLKQKLSLDEAAIDAEIAAEQDKRRDLQKGIKSAPGGSPEQFDLQAKLVQVETKLTDLANSRQAAEAQITAELQNQAWAKQVRAASDEIQERHRKEEQQAKIASLRQQGTQKGEHLNSQIAQQAAGTITGFVDQLSESAIRGKISFKSLADSAISDLERFAMKVLEERALLPVLNSLFGIAAPGSGATNLANILSQGNANYAGLNGSGFQGDLPGLFANGGDINSGWAVVGDGGDGSGSELFAPKGPGTILPHDVLQGLANAKSGGGGGSPSVTINNINNSSSQVQMKQGGVSYDAQAKQFVIHTVLEDMNQGGPLSSAMSGFAPK